jgi:hypothetical protein
MCCAVGVQPGQAKLMDVMLGGMGSRSTFVARFALGTRSRAGRRSGGKNTQREVGDLLLWLCFSGISVPFQCLKHIGRKRRSYFMFTAGAAVRKMRICATRVSYMFCTNNASLHLLELQAAYGRRKRSFPFPHHTAPPKHSTTEHTLRRRTEQTLDFLETNCVLSTSFPFTHIIPLTDFQTR